MRLNSIQVTIYWISAPSRSHLTPIQVSSCASHLHPCPISPSSRFLNSCVTSIQVVYYLHPGCSIQVPIFASHLHPGGVPYPPSSREWHFHTLQVPFHPHPYRLQACVSPPSRSHINCIQVPRFGSHFHPGRGSPPSRSAELLPSSVLDPSHLHPVLEICI